MRWAKGEFVITALNESVVALRWGLDAAPWDDKVASQRCREALKAVPQRHEYSNVRVETLPSMWR